MYRRDVPIRPLLIFTSQQSINCLCLAFIECAFCVCARKQTMTTVLSGFQMNHKINNINYALHSNSSKIYDLFCYSAGEIIIKLYIAWCTCSLNIQLLYPSSLSPYIHRWNGGNSDGGFSSFSLIQLPHLRCVASNVTNIASISRQ